jgi:ABC-type transport system involved in cytochrome c biogenesis permease subunit
MSQLTDSTFYFFLSTPAYFLAMLFYLLAAVFGRTDPRDAAKLGITAGAVRTSALDWGKLARWATGVGVLLSTVGIVLRAFELGAASNWALTVFLPVTTTYETLTFMAWIIPLAYLLLEGRYRFPGVGAIITGLAFAMLAAAASPVIAPRAVAPVVPALQSYWLVIHVLFMIIGIALFTTGFGASVIWLWKRSRGESSDVLRKIEELSYKANALGFPFYGIGGLIFGGIWAKNAWGAYWEWDPKETAMLIAWLAYAVYLHARLRWGGRDVRIAWLSIAAYIVVLYTWIGINYFVSSLHSFS